MLILRRYLTLILLVFVLSFGSAVQKNQAAGDDSGGGQTYGFTPTLGPSPTLVPTPTPDQHFFYLPFAMREEDVLHSIGPDGGSIVVMETDPSDSNILYAGTWGSGMYKSIDGGLSWKPINQSLFSLYINSLAIDPLNPSILYAGTYQHGVYKTTNGGATWAPTGPGLSQYPIIYAVAVDPITPNIVYVGTRNQQPGPPWGGGIYKTTDGGGSWVYTSDGLGEDWVYDIAIDPGNPYTVYAATHSKGVFKSESGGQWWEEINSGITDLSTRSLVIDPTNTNIVYVGTWHYGGVFKTFNRGASWNEYSDNLDHKIYSLNMDPSNPNILYASTYRQGIMATTDGAVSWHSGGLNPDMVYNVMVDPHRSETLYAGTMGDGLYKSTDQGLNWVSSNTGLNAASSTAVAAHWTDPITNTGGVTNTVVDAVYTSAFGGGIFKTTDFGKTWTRINYGLGELWIYTMAMSRTDPLTLYAGTDTTGFFKTIDGGMNWLAYNDGLPALKRSEATSETWLDPYLRPDLFDQAFFEGPPDEVVPTSPDAVASVPPILTIGVDSFDPQKLYLGTMGRGIYISYSSGEQWSATNLQTQAIYTILSDPFTPSILYAGCDSASNTMYRSLDGGATWQLSNTGIADLTVYALAADPATPGILYAGTSAGIYKSVDSGVNWAPFGLPGRIITALGVYPADPGTILAGTSDGLYISYDGGGAWKPLNTGLVNAEITSLALDPYGYPLINLVGTKAGGVYRFGIMIPPLRR